MPQNTAAQEIEEFLDNVGEEELLDILESLESLKDMQEHNLLEFTDWSFYEKQAKFRNEFFAEFEVAGGAKIWVVLGGNRSGKSATGASIVANIFSNYQDKKIWCATESDLSIKVQQAKLKKWIPTASIQDGDYNDSRGWKNNLIIGKSGSKLWFKTYQQERKAFQGEDLDLIWFDEECPWDVFQECLARTVDRGGKILFTFTSLMGFTRLVNKLLKPSNNIKSTTLTMLDNPYIPEAEKEKYIQECDKDELDSRVYGKPKAKGGLVYKEFDDDNIINPFDYVKLYKGNPKRYSIIEGIDPHSRTPHRWARFFYDKHEDILYLVDELVAPMESMIMSEFALMIKAKRMGVNPRYTEIDTSSQAPLPMRSLGDDENAQDTITVRTELSKAGISTILCMKDNSTGIRLVKQRLRHYSTEKQQVKPTFYAFHSCTSFIHEIRRYQWRDHISAKVAERSEQLNEVVKKDDHLCDLVKYCCIRLSQGGIRQDVKVKGPKFNVK